MNLADPGSFDWWVYAITHSPIVMMGAPIVAVLVLRAIINAWSDRDR